MVEISTLEIKTLTDAELTALRREFVRLCFSLRINSQGKGLNMSCLPPETDFRERESVHAFGEVIVGDISITSRSRATIFSFRAAICAAFNSAEAIIPHNRVTASLSLGSAASIAASMAP